MGIMFLLLMLLIVRKLIKMTNMFSTKCFPKVCHGLAELVYLLQKMFLRTRWPVFESLCDYAKVRLTK